jgi:subtilase-type serine protease
VDPDSVVGTHVRFPSEASSDLDFVTEVTGFDRASGTYTLVDDIPDSVKPDDAYTLSVLTAAVQAFDSKTGTYTLSEVIPDDAVGAGYTMSIVSQEQLVEPENKTFIDETRIGEAKERLVNNWISFPGDSDSGSSFVAFVIDFDPDTGRFTLNSDITIDLGQGDIYVLSTTRDGASGSTAIARAAGIDLGGGDAVVENSGSIDVAATAQARTTVEATRGLAEARADAVAEAVGVRMRDGDDYIHSGNSGSIRAAATVSADSSTNAQSAVALAVGVDAGEGANEVVNEGNIAVAARLLGEAEVLATAPGTVFQVTAGEPVPPSRAEAFGVRTGTGDDTVHNSGSILVTAEVSDAADEAGAEARAVGISTDGGDDVVTNNGLVSALTYTNNVATSGTGIDLGAGDDTLILGADSVVIGTVTLGDDNDFLTLVGTPMVRDASGALIDPQAGAGIDSLVLQGTGAFAGAPDGFEHATKAGTGTYALSGLATLDSLTIEEGMLQLGSDYDFAADGEFSTYIHSDGDHGKLLVNGSATLGGAIDIEKRGDTYISNGTRYSVLETTGSLSNMFADVTLPAPKPLLRYDLEQTVNSVDTVATAESFSLVASNPLYRQIARNLDRIANDATGDLADVLGTMQSLESGFDRAFASASPDSYLVSTQSTVATGLQTTRLLQNHLNSSRMTYRHSLQGQAAASGNVSFAYNNGIGAIGLSSAPVVTGHEDSRFMLAANEYSGTGVSQAIPQVASARGQVWMQGAKADGDYDEVDGYTDFDTDSSIVALGYDFRLNKRLIIGGTLGYAKTDLDMDQAGADGDIKAWSGGAYASWFNDKAYLEGGISCAHQSFDNQRDVVIGSIKRRARSDHDGNVWMGFLGSGYQFGFNGWSLEPYGSLYYFNAQEDSFRETGADSLNQVIDDRDTEALIGEVGANVERLQRLGKGTLDMHASVGLNHDFDIDDARIRYNYTGAPGTIFGIDDRDLESNSTVFGAGISYTSGRSTFSLDYRRQHNDDYDNDAIFAGMVVRF